MRISYMINKAMSGYQDKQLSLQSEQWQDCIVLKRVFIDIRYDI